MSEMTTNGILCLNKEKDMTSFLCCSVLRNLLEIKKIGHGGTLDPMATGVLPILCGNATKAMDILPIQKKQYLASFQLGITSDTEDIWGTITPVCETFPSEKSIQEVLPAFQGEIQQIPPMMSALKKDGVRLYALARQGIEIEREARTVHIENCSLVNYDQKTGKGTLNCTVSKGTYIRSLIHDIGQALQTGAVMSGLVRTMSAGYTIDQCVTLEELRNMTLEQRRNLILPTDTAFHVYEAIEVTPAQGIRFQNGGSLFLNRLPKEVSDICRVYSEGVFLGLGIPKGDQLALYKQFPI